MNLQPGDVIFVKKYKNPSLAEKFIQWCIRKVTNSEFIHVAYYIEGDTCFEANGFRRAGYTSMSNFADYEVKRLIFNVDERGQILHEILATEGSKYDYFELFSILLRKKFGANVYYDNKLRFICSEELYAACYKVKGVYIVDQKTGDVSPEDIWESKYLLNVKNNNIK